MIRVTQGSGLRSTVVRAKYLLVIHPSNYIQYLAMGCLPTALLRLFIYLSVGLVVVSVPATHTFARL